MGLYIAYRAAGLLGGKIWFESEENKGTTFYVTLPIESKEVRGERKLV
jgi:signal transduction histidine kinase